MRCRVTDKLKYQNPHCACMQCKWLESELKTEPILETCLLDPDNALSLVKGAKKIIIQHDWANTTKSASKHPSLKHITCSNPVSFSWCCIWDLALDKGIRGTTLAQCLFQSLSRPLFGDRTCPNCSDSIPTNQTFLNTYVSNILTMKQRVYMNFWRTVMKIYSHWSHRFITFQYLVFNFGVALSLVHFVHVCISIVHVPPPRKGKSNELSTLIRIACTYPPPFYYQTSHLTRPLLEHLQPWHHPPMQQTRTLILWPVYYESQEGKHFAPSV